MSLRDEKIKSLLGTNLDDLSEEELKKLCNKILTSKIHGICFSLYEGTQQPGDIVSDDQIIRRLQILKPYTSSIRTFSSLDEHARIVEIAKDMGFQTLVGAWLSDDMQSNDKEIEGLIKLANNNLVDVAAVGNEVIYRKELEENQLISYINYVKENIVKDDQLKLDESNSDFTVMGKDDMNIVKGLESTIKIDCEKCHNQEGVWWTFQTRSADEPETKFYRCIKCNHTWRDYT